MLIRIWRTQLRPGRESDYRRFIDTESLPMFQQQIGFLGVLYTRSASAVAVVSFWKDSEAVERLRTSPTYQQAVTRIMKTGFLLGEPSLEIFEVQVGFLTPDIVSQISALP
jgi:heme-degrading monooxygenase HmoA